MLHSAIWPIIAATWLMGAAPLSSRDAAAQIWQFDIPQQGAAGGIAAFSRQAMTVQLLAARDAVQGRRTNRLHGGYSVEAGLTKLLRGSGLRWLRTGPTTYSVVSVDKDHRQ
ncbi:hypothetical protein ASE95_14910 [Sphingomonas sp. Leaf231]|nr:hypothetical protein ASE95_14910 [Sphingomonas sp. Leaf231]